MLIRVGKIATRLRAARNYSVAPADVCNKLFEEAGEVARALVGELEGREGRGDLVQEAAQTIIVLASLVFITHPEADLDDAVAQEMLALASG